MLLALLALAWIAGIIATDLTLPPGNILGWLAGLGLGAAVLGWRRPLLRLAGLCLLVAALGGLRHLAAQDTTTARSVWLLAGQGPVLVQGVVAEEPRRSDDGQQLMLRSQVARLGERVGAVEGLLLVNLPPWPAYHYGQQLIIAGELEPPPAASRPNAFNYRDYLARKHIYALVQEPTVQVLPGNVGNPLLVGLLDFRDHCHAQLLRGLPEPQASVASGMLLGLKASIPDEIYQHFAIAGTAHILVISGWHLSLVAALVTSSAARLRLGRGTTFWVSLGAIWLYALFVGATGTVLRAAVMASLVVLATATERQSEPWTLLLAACWGLTLWNPQLLWDLGFQLSVLATASLFAFSRPVQRGLEYLPPLRWSGLRFVTTALATTLAVQVLVLPLILYHFGNLSVVAPLANVVLVPVVPYAMMLGAGALLAGLLTAPLTALPLLADLAGGLAWGLWLLAWLPLAYMTASVEWLAGLPWAAWRLPAFPLELLLTYYAVIAGAWLAWRQARRLRQA
jgi:competence protein ComEC